MTDIFREEDEMVIQGTIMSNAIRSSLWLGLMVGMATGAVAGSMFILVSYPSLPYLTILLASIMFGISGMFITASILFGAEYMKAKKSGMLSMWADYTTEEVMDIAKRNGLQISL